MLRLRAALCTLALLLQLSAPGIAQTRARRDAPKKRLNVLFLIADDLRPELGGYGNRGVKTPNIDRLAARGVRFDRAYAQYPLCNPSRTSLLTGRYPTETGVMDNNTYFRAAHPDWVTLPQHFKNNGYATLRTGKIFHGGIDDEVSWTEGGETVDPAIVNRGTNARPTPSPAAPRRERDPDETEGDPPVQAANEGERRRMASDRIVMLEGDGESHGDYKTATRAVNYLERFKDKSFFLAVGFVKPHSPPTAPRKFFDLYDPARVELPVDFASRPAAPPGFPELSVPRRNADLFIGRDASPEQAREMIRAYRASTSFMDAQVGRVLDELERLGLQGQHHRRLLGRPRLPPRREGQMVKGLLALRDRHARAPRHRGAGRAGAGRVREGRVARPLPDACRAVWTAAPACGRPRPQPRAAAQEPARALAAPGLQRHAHTGQARPRRPHRTLALRRVGRRTRRHHAH